MIHICRSFIFKLFQ